MRFMRFVLSQLIWLAAFAYFGFNNRILERPGSEIIVFMILVVGIPVFLNLLLWFGSNLVRAFQDDDHTHKQSQNDDNWQTSRKRKNDPVDSLVQGLTDAELEFLRDRLSEKNWQHEEVERGLITDDGELVKLKQNKNY